MKYQHNLYTAKKYI